MKISVNDQEIVVIGEDNKDLFSKFMPRDDIEKNIAISIKRVIENKYISCLKKLRRLWQRRLEDKGLSIPSNDEEFASLVFQQPEYRDYSDAMRQREPQFDETVLMHKARIKLDLQDYKNNLQ